MTDHQEFKTTNINLAGALLLCVPTTTLDRITPEPSVDGKRLLIIGYPSEQAQVVADIVDQFHSRRLVVHLYAFNRIVNVLRDRLKQDTGNHALR